MTLRTAVIPGGLGPHKWRDRRLLAELTEAAGLGPAEHLLITDESGRALETDRASVFAVTGDVLRTPPADGRILPGTARGAILRAARREGISLSLAPLTVAELRAAAEVFVCNAVYGILPVRSIDGTEVPPGQLASHFAGTLAGAPPEPPASPGRSRPPRPAPAGPAPAGPAPGRLASRPPAVRPLIILIDNYDSFTYNLAHLIAAAGAAIEVVRNDEVAVGQIENARPAGVVISPVRAPRPTPGSASRPSAPAPGPPRCSASASGTRRSARRSARGSSGRPVPSTARPGRSATTGAACSPACRRRSRRPVTTRSSSTRGHSRPTLR